MKTPRALARGVFIEAQVRYHPLKALVLLLQLPEPAELRDAQPSVLLLPSKVRLLRDLHLPTDFGHPSASLSLPEREGDLRFSQSRLIFKMISLKDPC